MHTTNKKIYPHYVSKNNSDQKKELFFNDSKWKGMTLSYSKKLLALLRGITSKHYSEFYCLSCLHSFRTETKLKSHKKLCQNKDFCNIVMLSEDTKKYYN